MDITEKFIRFVNSGTKIGIFEQDGTNYYDARITSRGIWNSLFELGIEPKKSNTLAVSPALASSPNFWRGVVDADGSILRRTTGEFARCSPVGYYPIVQISSGSRGFLEQFSSYIQNSQGKVPNKIIHSKNKKGWCYVVRISGKLAVKVLVDMYKNSSSDCGLDRKRVIALSVISDLSRWALQKNPGRRGRPVA